MAKRERIFLGLHSGAAADGAAAALLRATGRGERMKVAQVAALTRPADADLRRRLRAALDGEADAPADLAGLDGDLGRLLAEAGRDVLKQAGAAREQVVAAGLIGPAVTRLAPDAAGHGAPVELGSPAVVARGIRLPVVAGFAAGDLAAGGAGGPMTAWPDWLIFHDKRLSRVVLQLGAIATMTFIGSAAASCEVVAFDVGPGTVLIDALARRLFGREVDADGAIASHGRVFAAMLNELQAGEHFHRRPSKTTCRRDWSGVYLRRLEAVAAKHGCRGADLIATVTDLTARAIARDVLSMTERPHEVILAGGGARNIHLAGRIRSLLSPCSTYAMEHYGLDGRGHVATCAAILAAARVDKLPAHCHAATGAAEPAILGSLTLP